jgi:hypothetical protein
MSVSDGTDSQYHENCDHTSQPEYTLSESEQKYSGNRKNVCPLKGAAVSASDIKFQKKSHYQHHQVQPNDNRASICIHRNKKQADKKRENGGDDNSFRGFSGNKIGNSEQRDYRNRKNDADSNEEASDPLILSDIRTKESVFTCLKKELSIFK